MTAKYSYGTGRVDAQMVLIMLDHIANHGGVAKPELCELLGASPATLGRLIASTRQQWGVEIVWRRDNSMPSHGEYYIDDWGVFDRSRVRKFIGRAGT